MNTLAPQPHRDTLVSSEPVDSSLVEVDVLRVGEGGEPDALPLPAYKTHGAAGMDLHAALRSPLTLAPGQRAMIPTGIALALPRGFEAQVRPRSGLAWQHGITVLNAPGTIDEDYRGELSVVLVNFGAGPFVLKRGDRIAQLVIAPVVRCTWNLVTKLPPSARGEGGYGSTGR